MNKLSNVSISIKGSGYVYLTAECDGPLKNLYFMWNTEEWDDFCTHKRATYSDIAHQCFDTGETCTFYNLDMPYKTSGTMEIKYQVVNIPHIVRKILARYVKAVMRGFEKDAPEDERDRKNHLRGAEHVLKLDGKTLDRWVRLYGQGKGKVEIELRFWDEKLAEEKPKFEKRLENQSFRDMLDRLKAIAGNRTYAYYHNAKVELGYDWAGYTFTAGGMYGGLINHGSEEEPDWSLHT